MAELTTLGERVRRIRRHLSLTQEELAKAIGVTSQHISYIEQGVHGPSIDLLIRIAQELNVTTDFLLTGVAATTEILTTASLRIIRRDMEKIREALQRLKP